MIRLAAVGDIHYDRNSAGRLGQFLPRLEGAADLFLIAGDLTQIGSTEEISALANDLATSPVPVVAVLGNHDHHSEQGPKVIEILTRAGVTVLEGSAVTFDIAGTSIGVAGVKGFGGGFVGACATDFGEISMKDFIRITKTDADALKIALLSLETDYKIALTHYSPCRETLMGEKKEIYPFLGSYLLAEAIDDGQADICFHGHAHHGVERGLTAGGIPVRNVAMPVIRHPFNIYCLNKEGLVPHTDVQDHAPAFA
ncbi:MAG: metallophosphoesterase [Bdellovibrionota bacterium]